MAMPYSPTNLSLSYDPFRWHRTYLPRMLPEMASQAETLMMGFAVAGSWRV